MFPKRELFAKLGKILPQTIPALLQFSQYDQLLRVNKKLAHYLRGAVMLAGAPYSGMTN